MAIMTLQTWATFQDPGSAIFVAFEKRYMLFIVRHILSCLVTMNITHTHIAPCLPLCYLLGLLDRICPSTYICYLDQGIG